MPTMKRGPKPKKTASKVLAGNPSRRPIAGEKTNPLPSEAPAPPDHLSEEAQAEWDRIVPPLARIGALATVDRAVLTLYCETWADFLRYQKEQRGRPTMVAGPNGIEYPDPLIKLVSDTRKSAAALLRDLGLTPASRQRIMPGPDEEDETGDALDALTPPSAIGGL